jgi:hypothetical protein
MRSLCSAIVTIFIFISFSTSNAMGHEETLLLVSKDPNTWQIDTSGATAQLTVNRQKGTFNCSGQRLEPEQQYALIQRDDSYPRGRGFILSVTSSTANGTLLLAGKWSNWRGKIWLVLADDVRGGAADEQLDQLISWQPKRYLFESRPLL